MASNPLTFGQCLDRGVVRFVTNNTISSDLKEAHDVYDVVELGLYMSGGFNQDPEDGKWKVNLVDFQQSTMSGVFGKSNQISYGRECILIQNFQGLLDTLDAENCSYYLTDSEQNITVQDSDGTTHNVVKYYENQAVGLINARVFGSIFYASDSSGTAYRNIGIPSITSDMAISQGGLTLPRTPLLSGGYSEYQSPIKTRFEINIPVFTTLADVEEYIHNGNIQNSINVRDEEEEELLEKLYYYDYTLSLVNTQNQSLYNPVNTAAKFKLIEEGDKVRFVKDHDKIYKLTFNCTEVALLDDSTHTFTNVNVDTLIDIIIKNSTATVSNVTYYGDIFTNIPFVENFDDEDDESGQFIRDTEFNYTGETSDVNYLSRSYNALHNIYYVNQDELDDIANILYADDQTFVDTLKDGLWMYQENPINCIISVMYCPLSINPYILGKQPSKLKFGNFIYNGELPDVSRTSYDRISGTGLKVINFNGRILPTYGDYRDYTNLKYSIFLPFYGIVQLDSNVVGKSFKIESYFDVYQSILRYIFYSDNIIIGSYECNIGTNLALVGSNWVQSSAEKMNAAFNTVSSLIGDVSKPSLSSGLSGASELWNGTQKQLQDNSVSVVGTTSGKFNYNDDNNIYLIIEETESIKPTNLNELYGKPCYFMNKLESLSGFAVVSDIQLKTKATAEEEAEIKQILAGGVYF